MNTRCFQLIALVSSQSLVLKNLLGIRKKERGKKKIRTTYKKYIGEKGVAIRIWEGGGKQKYLN